MIVYRISCFSLLLVVCLLLPACGRQVEIIQPHQFKLMADHMPNELINRDILDSSRNYVAGVWEEKPQAYGNILYERLLANFVFSETVISDKTGSFANIVSANSKENSVVKRKDGFSIVTVKKEGKKKKNNFNLERRLDVDMVAITDWDGDGQKDWIVACKLLNTRGAIPRIYYVTIANPAPVGMLRGKVVAVYDDMGPFGRLYLSESTTKSSAQVEDVVPGLRPVTSPPVAKPKEENKIKERTLD